jgi:sortase A
MGRRSKAVACAALLVVAACGGNATAGPVAIGTSVATTSSATTSTTIATTTTTSTTTSTTVSTSTTSTTIVAATLPNPEAPPADPRADVPLVELGTIEIPAIGVTKSFYDGITLTTLDKGPGHWPGTAMPGQQGNVVIAGHRVSHDKPFRNIDKLVPGDDVVLTTTDGRFDYKVTGIEVVTPDALWIVDQTPDYTATLFACTPPGSTKQRIVIHLAYAPNG